MHKRFGAAMLAGLALAAGAAGAQEFRGAEGEGAPLAAAVLEGQRVEVTVHGDDLAAPVGRDLLDHQARVRRCLHRAAPLRRPPVT